MAADIPRVLAMIGVDSAPSILEPNGSSMPTRAWFCLRSQLKREHIAASHLRQAPDIEVFLPRIRFRRNTRQGPAWVTEALFPNYLFARFDWMTSLRRVQVARGVAGVVHFGYRWPTVPEEILEDLRRSLGEEALVEIRETLRPGDTVEIARGAFQGLQAVVTRVMPARERVQVLLEFLGRQTTVDVSLSEVASERDVRSRLGGSGDR